MYSISFLAFLQTYCSSYKSICLARTLKSHLCTWISVFMGSMLLQWVPPVADCEPAPIPDKLCPPLCVSTLVVAAIRWWGVMRVILGSPGVVSQSPSWHFTMDGKFPPLQSLTWAWAVVATLWWETPSPALGHPQWRKRMGTGSLCLDKVFCTRLLWRLPLPTSQWGWRCDFPRAGVQRPLSTLALIRSGSSLSSAGQPMGHDASLLVLT